MRLQKMNNQPWRRKKMGEKANNFQNKQKAWVEEKDQRTKKDFGN